MKISVIIPCYNVERYIGACLESVLLQTHKDIEVICVDDGSTDNTVSLIREFSIENNIEITLKEQKNKGAPAARNVGLGFATGEYIQFLDADDILKADKISSQVLLAKQNNYPGLIIGSYQRINEQGEVLSTSVYLPDNEKNVWLSLMQGKLGITSSNLFKSDFFRLGHTWNESLKSSQEYNLMFEILKKEVSLIYDPTINTIIKARASGSISKSNLGQKWIGVVQLRAEILEYIKSHYASEVSDAHYQILFETIRMLYPYSPTAANDFYLKYIPRDFSPEQNQTNGRLYLLIFKVFGFNLAEKIKLGFKSAKAG